jgi:RHS repeat-associated protein
MLTRLNELSGPLAFFTLAAFAITAVRPSTAWAQTADAIPTVEASRQGPVLASGVAHTDSLLPRSNEPDVATAAAPASAVLAESDPAALQSVLPESASSTTASSPPLKSHGPAATVTSQPNASGAAATTRALPTGDDKSGVTNKTISTPKGSGTIEGMGESFSAQLSTGIATFSVPFALPAARGGAQPSLGLSYSSSAGFGVAGMGWQLGIPFIARQTDRGVPKYLDQAGWHAEQDRFVFNGGQELVPICVVDANRLCAGALTQVSLLPDQGAPLVDEVMPVWSRGWQYFRPRVEGSFLRFFWSPDHRTWRVQDKSGVTMELGVPLNEPAYTNGLEANPDQPNEIYKWHLVRQYDAYGSANPESGAPQPVNVVVYRYLRAGENGGMAYLSDIFDTPPAADPTAAILGTYAHHTRLVYEPRTDPTASYRSGWKIEQRLRLRRIDVTSKSFGGAPTEARQLVRRYHLGYDANFHVSHLTGVQVEGRCEVSVAESPAGTLPETSGCPRLPPMTFEYGHVQAGGGLAGYERFDGQVRKLASSPAHSVDEELTDLFDIDSDALPDVLVTATGLYGQGHGVFFNAPNGAADSFGAATPMSVSGVLGANASTITLRNLNLTPLDLDGDAKINLLHMPAVKTYSMYTPEKVAGGWTWKGRTITSSSGQSPQLDFGRDTLDIQVLDVDFDGLVDLVRTTGTELQTFFSLGRYPGGDGQFGNASRTGAASASISNDPVKTCVPWSGAPVRFSDPDVKLGDLNGDGIADIVRVRRGNIIYWPGRGNGFWGTGRRDDCAPSTFGRNRHVPMAKSPVYSDIQGDSLRLDDVNGDGLDDLVQVRFGEVDVYLNVDGTSWTDRHILRNTPASPSFANRVRLVDVNGSGTRDILWGNAENYRYIDLAGGERPGLLARVDNGLGKTTDLEYSTSTAEMLAAAATGQPCSTANPWSGAWCTKMPTVVHVVKRVTERDNITVAGKPPGEYVTEYSYRDPVFDGQQREFRGFGLARVERVGDANSPTDTTDSAFLLGACRDESPADGFDACSIGERWRDNPREALKGLPVLSERFNEAGTYLSTQRTTYRLRHLYTGLDGRAVRHAFETKRDSYLYDTATFVATAGSQPALEQLENVSVETELALGTVQPAAGSPGITRRATSGTAELRTSTVVDPFGNRVDAISHGCIAGAACPAIDEIVTTRTAPALIDAASSAWIWRTVHSYVTGSAHPIIGGGALLRRNETLTQFNAQGAPTQTNAILSGTVLLDRWHSGGAAVAAPPADRSQDHPAASPLFVSHSDYDSFGNLTGEQGANGRCRSVGYDAEYRQLATSESVLAGDFNRGAPPGSSCGNVALSTSAEYDRGLELVTRVVDMQSQPTQVTYDGFGRLSTLSRPHPALVGIVSALPSVKVEYFLPPSLGPGARHSIIHTMTQDGADHAENAYLESWSYVDGFGRTIVTLSEADASPAGGDGGSWIASGLSNYDNKGALQRKYLEFFSNANPMAFGFGAAPSAPFGQQTYDAFGRQARGFDLDGTETLRSIYYALSTDRFDAADLTMGSGHEDTPASEHKDGHGRTTIVTERYKAGSSVEARQLRTQYLPTGEPEVLRQLRFPNGVEPGSPPPTAPTLVALKMTRWMRYDSLGRMVLNHEPNTTRYGQIFTEDTTADSAPSGGTGVGFRAWRYAYNDAGDLVGTSNGVGCGVNFLYDAAGRLLSEDYSPCIGGRYLYSPATWSPTNPSGMEVLYFYDSVPSSVSGVTQPPNFVVLSPSFSHGRLVAVFDRGSTTWSSHDGRGRVIQTSLRIAKPVTIQPPPVFQNYAPRWYSRSFAYDAADREVGATTGATRPNLLGTPIATGPLAGQASVVTTEYSRRGTVQRVGGSYNLVAGGTEKALVDKVTRTADGLLDEIVYGDAASTATGMSYDNRRRLSSVTTYRGPPPAWSDGAITPAPPAGTPPNTQPSFQLLLQDDHFTYDVVGNPTTITDNRIAEEWPAGAKPITRDVVYDDLYRVARVDYSSDSDSWTSPFAAENSGTPALQDPRRAKPATHVAFDDRVQWQTVNYDWLGNTISTDDDAHGFYDRSLGTIVNYGSLNAYGLRPHQLIAANNTGSGARDGSLAAQYDITGNLFVLEVRRNGPCLPAGSVCSQYFLYDWDEVGRLVRARRWDAVVGTFHPSLTPPSAMVDYLYNAADERVLKIVSHENGPKSHTAYLFDSLELRRAPYVTATGEYTLDDQTEVPYLSANGVRLARAVLEDTGDAEPRIGGARLHVFFELGDHLGSTSVVLDQATSELVERSTLQAYGAVESDYRPERWGAFREDYRFTGKEEDVEVGLQYFGKRFYAPLLGRWGSPDPLTIHALGGDLNVYAYVSGRALKAIDPLGLDPSDKTTIEQALADQTGGKYGVDHRGMAPPPAPTAGPSGGGGAGGAAAGPDDKMSVGGGRGISASGKTPTRTEPGPYVTAAAGVGASMLPVAGEVMDAETLADSEASAPMKILAVGSLTLSLLTLTTSPNAGAFFRAADDVGGGGATPHTGGGGGSEPSRLGLGLGPGPDREGYRAWSERHGLSTWDELSPKMPTDTARINYALGAADEIHFNTEGFVSPLRLDTRLKFGEPRARSMTDYEFSVIIKGELPNGTKLEKPVYFWRGDAPDYDANLVPPGAF